MKIIIIGGSIGGLSTGIALLDKGFDVEVYERTSGNLTDRGAGLVVQPDMIEYLNEHQISTALTFGVPARQRQILDGQGHAILKYHNDTTFTSWSHLWQQLKNYFPAERYFGGHELTRIEENKDTVAVHFSNGVTRTAGLLVGADGYSSAVRKHILPGIEPQYTGYIAYRGLIAEKELTPEEQEFFSDRFTLYPYEHSHILSYMVPGADGNLTRGNRLYNWVWYVNKTSAELEKVLTDKNGHKRTFTVPAGFMSEAAVTELHQLAVGQLPPVVRNRVLQTHNPFVQVIVDLAVPRMYQGRIALLGDAAFVVRPHTASGTAKAYRDAIALAHVLQEHADVSTALFYWNREQMMYAEVLAAHGKQLAYRSQLGFQFNG